MRGHLELIDAALKCRPTKQPEAVVARHHRCSHAWPLRVGGGGNTSMDTVQASSLCQHHERVKYWSYYPPLKIRLV